MKIVVCLHAPRGADGHAVLGLDDAHALALALALPGEHTITAVLPGPPADEAHLRRALAAGATRAVRVVGEDYGAADFHTLGQALAAAIKRVGAELVLAGARTEDDGLGAVPASIARHLGAPHVACIEALAPSADGGVEISVRGGGRRRRLRVSLPAVLSVVATGTAKPTLRDDDTSARAVEVLSLVDPEATVVRRRTELLGQPELPQRETEEVASAAALVAALAR